MQPKLTIAITAYNVERYIAETIKSCLNQTGVSHQEYEILIIDDGSIDDTRILAEQIANTKTNVRVVSQPNGGVSVARNTALSEAKGEYFWFVDGDDVIEDNAVSIILKNIENSNCDIYIYNYREFNENGLSEKSDFERYPQPLSGEYIHFSLNRSLPILLWLTVYRLSFLKDNNLTFLPGIIHEDFEFSVRAHHIAKKIKIMSPSIYRYRIIRENSIMHQVRKDNVQSFISWTKVLQSHSEFFNHTNNEYVKSLIGQYSFMMISYRYNDSFNTDNLDLYNSIKHSLYKNILIGGSVKRKIVVCLLYLLPDNLAAKVFCCLVKIR